MLPLQCGKRFYDKHRLKEHMQRHANNGNASLPLTALPPALGMDAAVLPAHGRAGYGVDGSDVATVSGAGLTGTDPLSLLRSAVEAAGVTLPDSDLRCILAAAYVPITPLQCTRGTQMTVDGEDEVTVDAGPPVLPLYSRGPWLLSGNISAHSAAV